MTEVGPISGWKYLLGACFAEGYCFRRSLYHAVRRFIWCGTGIPRPVIAHSKSEPSDLRSVSGVFRETFALRGRGIIQLGLLLLIATPVARVAFSIFGFAEEHDRLYVIVASIVLLILLYSLVGSAWSV